MAEEKGYWFSTENGTHIHAEEGESKEQAMGKKFKSFKKGQSSLNFPKPTKEEHQETLDKEIKDSFKNREEGLKYLESQTNDWSDEEKESLKKRIDRVYPENKNDNPLKAESRSMINEKQANDPRVLADKLDDKEAEKTLKYFGERPEWAKQIDEEFKPKFETAKQIDSLYKKSKEKNLSFERMLLNEILDNPDKYNEFTLGNRQYKRNGKSFDMYEDGRHIWTGTYSSVANSVNDYYEKNHKD